MQLMYTIWFILNVQLLSITSFSLELAEKAVTEIFWLSWREWTTMQYRFSKYMTERDFINNLFIYNNGHNS